MNTVVLPDGYRPSEKEGYMSPMQLEYFRQKLLREKEEMEHEVETTLDVLATTTNDMSAGGDDADLANDETEKYIELKTRDRARKHIMTIDAALNRIANGTYGYSDISGDPIGLARLDARPVVRMTIEEQEEHEAQEKLYG